MKTNKMIDLKNLILFILFLVIAISSQAQWTKVSNAPSGGDIQCLAYNGGSVFAGTYGGGVFMTANNGSTWTQVSAGLTDLRVFAIAFSGTTIFAGTESGVFRSTDNGTTWAAANTGLTTLYVKSIAVSGSNLFAGTIGGVFLSKNNGDSWSAVNTGLTSLGVNSLVVSGSSIFVGTFDKGVFVSTDNGTSWTATSMTHGMNPNSLAASGGNIFAATTGAGIFLSTDNGSNWTPVNSGITSTFAQSLAINGSYIFAGTGAGLFVSTNNGKSWTASNNNIYPKSLVAYGNYVFAGTGQGVFLSVDNGSTWSTTVTGLTSPNLKSIAFSGSNAFAGLFGNQALYKSSDNGVNWTTASLGTLNANSQGIMSLAISGSTIFAGSFGVGVLKSTDNGVSWATANNGLTNTYVYSLAISGINIFAGMANGGVYLSTDNGSSWSSISISQTSTYVYSLAVIGNNIFAATGDGVFLSTNNGSSWSAVNTGLTNTFVQSLAISGNDIFAGTNGGVFLSNNNGATWTPMNTGLNDLSVQTLAINGSYIFAGTLNGGVFMSSNNGGSWKAVNSGLTNLYIISLAFSADKVFAGTYGNGIWSRSLLDFIPTVTSFSPTSGPVGTSVTITGTNFDATPTNNTVFFGAAKANVTAASPTQLIVTVPVGATYQLISVLVNGLTAYSTGAFDITFPNTGVIDANSFSTKVDFSTNADPVSLHLADFDLDGNPDYFSSNYGSGSGNTVSVFQNTATSGAITSASLAARVNLSANTGSVATNFADLDGDGKLDIVAVNQGNGTLSVFKNMGVSGSITTSSFATKVDFTTGTTPNDVAVRDFDGDGKPDIAVVNNSSGTLSIFKNNTSLGVINSTSFMAKVDFATGPGPWSLAIADFNQDGKPDIAVSNSGSNYVSIYKNTSSFGSIDASSFAAKVDFTVGSSPRFISTADIDGDGKQDIASANNTSGTASVLRNTTSSTVIDANAFAAKVDFTAGSGPWGINFGDVDGDGKPELAVINNSNSSVSVFKNLSTPGVFTSSSLGAKVNYTTGGDPVSVVFGDADGDGKTDMATVGSTVLSLFRNTTLGPLPVAPVVSAATSISASGFTANWSSVAGATGYQLDISTDNFTTFVTGYNSKSVAGTTQIVTGLTANTAYQYRVRATNSSGESANSNMIAVTTLTVAPVATAAKSISSSGFTANWNTVTGATGYQLDISTDNFSTFVTGYNSTSLTTTNQIVTGLLANTAYQYRVRATNSVGTSANSNVITVTTLGVAPAAPTSAASTNVSSSGFTASWNSVAGATGYQLDISTDNFTTFIMGYNSKSESGTSDVVTGLAPSTTYQYRVRAFNSFGTSANSNVIVTSTLIGPPTAPVAAAASTITSTGFAANWNSVSGATGYQLDISTDNFITFVTGYNSKSETSTTDVVTGLTAGTTYQYRVRATNSSGASTNSNVISVTTNKLDQTITFNSIVDVTVGDPAFNLSATASSGLAVTYTTSSSKVSLNGNAVTIVSAGRDTITASQSGNTNYNAATPVKQSFCIKPAKPIVTLTGSNTATPMLTSSASTGNQWFLNGVAISDATNTTLVVSAPGAYAVQSKVDDCISSPSDNFQIIVTGDINLPESLGLYPNPCSDFVFVTGIQNQVTETTAMDAVGGANPIKSEKQGDLLRGDISALSRGMYILKVVDGGQVHFIKFIKQ
jgi:hypothetical protein